MEPIEHREEAPDSSAVNPGMKIYAALGRGQESQSEASGFNAAQANAKSDNDGKSSQVNAPSEKPNELLQAQIASYASEAGYNIGRQLYQRMGTIEGSKTGDITYADSDDPNKTNVIQRQAYVEHLRQIGGSRNEAVQVRAQALEAYKDFGSDVTDWVRSINAERQHPDFENYDFHPGFLGKGEDSTGLAFKHDGKEYVAKFSNSAKLAGINVDDVVLDLSLGRGMPHLEQLAAISYEDGVVISERMAGKQFSSLDTRDLGGIREEQLAQALSTMKEARGRGIFFDGDNVDNYFYDPQEGFGFIDYANNQYSRLYQKVVESDSDMASEFIENLMGINRIDGERKHPQTIGEISARIGLLGKYRSVCERAMQSEGLDYADAIHKVDELIADYERSLNNLSV